MTYLVIHGPNLNMLGQRDPQLYGSNSLAQIDARIAARGTELGVAVQSFQANGEGAIIDFLQQSAKGAVGIIINPGAYGHYSYAIHDALMDTRLPIAEVHLSNVHARDSWRQKSVISPIARGVITGFGWRGYTAALDLLVALAKEKS